MKEELLKYFPQHIQAILNEEDLNSNEEIRIRNNLPLILRFGQAQKILNNNKRRTSCWNSWNSSVRCKWTSC